MHRFPATSSQMQPRTQGSAGFPPQDQSQPYPGYPPPHGQDRSNSGSPYVHPQGIPIPPQPDNSNSSNKAAPGQPQPATESPPTSARPSRKRKLQSPAPDSSQQHPQQLPHQLPPPPMPGQPQYDYYPPPPHQPVDSQGNPVQPQPQGSGPETSPSQSGGAAGGRQLSTSKRAEQNRKAQRAFRERRDAHVKALESRSQLLDAALASADEANRRWEECRALVDQLRVENAALRAALGAAAAHAQGPPAPVPPPDPAQKAQENGAPHHGSRGASADRDADD